MGGEFDLSRPLNIGRLYVYFLIGIIDCEEACHEQKRRYVTGFRCSSHVTESYLAV